MKIQYKQIDRFTFVTTHNDDVHDIVTDLEIFITPSFNLDKNMDNMELVKFYLDLHSDISCHIKVVLFENSTDRGLLRSVSKHCDKEKIMMATLS